MNNSIPLERSFDSAQIRKRLFTYEIFAQVYSNSSIHHEFSIEQGHFDVCFCI